MTRAVTHAALIPAAVLAALLAGATALGTGRALAQQDAAPAADAAAPSDAAAPAGGGASLDAVSQVVTAMGYDVMPSSTKKSIKITANAYTIGFVVSEDRRTYYLWCFLNDYGADELARLDLHALLAQNDVGLSYFSFGKDASNGRDDLYINRNLPFQALTPQVLRASIEDMTGTAEKLRKSWDIKK